MQLIINAADCENSYRINEPIVYRWFWWYIVQCRLFTWFSFRWFPIWILFRSRFRSACVMIICPLASCSRLAPRSVCPSHFPFPSLPHSQSYLCPPLFSSSPATITPHSLPALSFLPFLLLFFCWQPELASIVLFSLHYFS